MLTPAGILLPESVLRSPFITVLAAFVAVNTVIYATLAIAKLLPAVHWGDLLPGRQRRSETRSIFPQPVDVDGGKELRQARVSAAAASIRKVKVLRTRRRTSQPDPRNDRRE